MAPTEQIISCRSSSIAHSNRAEYHLSKGLRRPEVMGKKVVSIGKDSESGVMNLIQNIVVSDDDQNSPKDPFFVFDIGAVVSQWRRWKENIPTIRPFYAVKCNPDRTLLATLAALGTGFDCASRAEIEAVLNLGVSAGDIVYANPCKGEGHVKYTAEVEVNLTTFDYIDEVSKLKTHHPNTAAMIRIHPPVDSAAQCPLGPKFGGLPEELRSLLEGTNASGLNVVGVSFHVGSGATRPEAYSGAISAARGVFDLAGQLGMPPMTVLNVGGSFTSSRFEDAAAAIRAGLDEFLPDPH